MTAAYQRGDVDEASRQGVLAGPAVVEQALHSKARATQLAGIAAAPYVEARPELLPALADVASGADRRTAIPAAQAARQIARELATEDLPDDIGEDDVMTWRALFDQLAHSESRFIEVRVLALDTVTSLAQTVTPSSIGFDLATALHDRDPAFRVAAVQLVPRPTPAALRTPLADTVKDDADDKVALAAAQALCGDARDPALAALGARGLARVKKLVAGRPPKLVRDAMRCLKR
ncbi:MAG TPA: hypothetical protein VFV99_27200 [Kofleriaceae bacterium]|nr:hypothetical protein [Kofleriaceae bacterium]